MACLVQVLKGIKSLQTKTKGNSHPRLPMTPELSARIRQVWVNKPLDPDHKMLWAAALLCFFGFLRAGEVTVPSDTAYDEGAHLKFADVAVDSNIDPQVIKVRIKASKTDPFCLGVDISLGKTQKELCLIAAILPYLLQRGSGPVPSFKFADGKPLIRPRFVTKIREALIQAGVDCTPYSGHSFRIWATTTAAKQGIEEATIKMLVRWRSSAYQRYIRTPRVQLAAISQRMV